MRRAALVAVTAVGVVASGDARAAPRSLRVEYEAPPSCPDEARFVELARERVRRWPAIEDDGDLVVLARAEEQEGAFVGRLSLEDAAGRSLGARTIQEASCEDVVLALALFLAVALEADAAESSGRNAPSAPSDAAPSAPTREERPPPADAMQPPRAAPPGAVMWGLLARAQGVTGRAPDAAPGASVGIELGARWTPSLLRPFGGLGIDAAPYSVRREGRGRVELGWGAVVGRACLGFDLRPSASISDPPRLEPWACVRAEGGSLRAASRGYATNRTERLPWYAVGSEAGVELRLSPLLGVGAFAHAVLPLVRHELVLHEAPLFRAPVVAGGAGLELKLRIL